MTRLEATADDAPDVEISPARRWIILITVTATTTLYAMTILIVAVVLPQMQGSLSATPDQIAWVMTFNILATVVVTPITGWFTSRFGWRNVMLYSMVGFTVATMLCGLAGSLESLVVYRIFQGGFGAPVVPLAQAIILSTFPRRQHSVATSIFGMGVVVGPIIGPYLGGYLTELYNWRWAFFMIVPMAIDGLLATWFFLHDGGRQRGVRLDWTGFVALAVALAALQLVLDRGERQDWFYSTEIILECGIGIAAFYIYLTHSMMTDRPFLNLGLLRDRNYTLGLIIVTVYGMLNFTPMVMLPPLLKGLGGYPESIIGTLLGFRGIGAVIGFASSAWVGRMDPRIGITAGYLIQAWSGWYMMGFNVQVSMFDVALTSTLQGVAVGLVWVPLTTATFATLDKRHLTETSAVYHLLRNVGSSVFISLSVFTLIHTSQINYSRLVQFVHPFNEVMRHPRYAEAFEIESIAGLARISAELVRQATMIGFINAFGLYTLACVVVLPLVFFIRVPKQGADATST